MSYCCSGSNQQYWSPPVSNEKTEQAHSQTAELPSAIDYYSVLGVHSHVDCKGVKKAYHREAKKWHPDKNPTCRKQAELQFKLVGEAYAVLSDPLRRAHYDTSLNNYTWLTVSTPAEINLFQMDPIHIPTNTHYFCPNQAQFYRCGDAFSFSKTTGSNCCFPQPNFFQIPYCCASPRQQQSFSSSSTRCPICDEGDALKHGDNFHGDDCPVPRYRNRYRSEGTCFHITRSNRNRYAYEENLETEI